MTRSVFETPAAALIVEEHAARSQGWARDGDTAASALALQPYKNSSLSRYLVGHWSWHETLPRFGVHA